MWLFGFLHITISREILVQPRRKQKQQNTTACPNLTCCSTGNRKMSQILEQDKKITALLTQFLVHHDDRVRNGTVKRVSDWLCGGKKKQLLAVRINLVNDTWASPVTTQRVRKNVHCQQHGRTLPHHFWKQHLFQNVLPHISRNNLTFSLKPHSSA